ncbi:MAG: hypothetical protein FWF29_08685 [Treponema sp.]|nr:hypothetical protein [Treponema sp.]
MKRAVLGCIVFVLIATGCATLGNGSKGTLAVTTDIGMEGYLDMITDDQPQNKEPKVVMAGSNKNYGNLDLTYQKQGFLDGTITALVGVDYYSGLSGELSWKRMIMDGNFNVGVSFNRDNTWDMGVQDWPYIVIYSNYDSDKFGVTGAVYNKYWSQTALSDWRLLYFRREPNSDGTYANNLGYANPAVQIDQLNGYYIALDGQFRVDLSYREIQQEWRQSYRDYFRASSIVARNWLKGDQTIAFSYKPLYLLNGNLNAGVAFTNIGIAGGKSYPNYFLSSDHNANPKIHGAFERTVFGAKYETTDLAVSAQVNLGDTGGVNGWWFLMKQSDDRQFEDGYFDIFGGGAAGYPARSEIGFNVGARANVAKFVINGDTEWVGFSDLAHEGMMAAGARAAWSGIEDILTPSITMRTFNWLGVESRSGGLFGVHPELSVNVVPNNLTADVRIDFVTGVGKVLSNYNFIKFYPRLLWTFNGYAGTVLEFGYIYRYDFSKYESKAKENSINLRFEWNF